VIDSFGGSISCRSLAPHGTEFTLSLPEVRGQATASPPCFGETVSASSS
jgi:hypothetical protein